MVEKGLCKVWLFVYIILFVTQWVKGILTNTYIIKIHHNNDWYSNTHEITKQNGKTQLILAAESPLVDSLDFYVFLRVQWQLQYMH